MQRIHALTGLITVCYGEAYAQCACGLKTWGDDEDKAFEAYRSHRRETNLRD